MGQRTHVTTRAVVATTSIAISFSLGGLVLAGAADAAVPYVATNAVNVRSGPGTSHKVLGVLSVGSPVSGDATANGWVQITYKGSKGYVHADYLKKSATTPTSPSATQAPSTTPTVSTSPSLVLRTMFPVKPSQTTTSATPL